MTLTALELLSDFELGPGDPICNLLLIRLFVMYLADHVCELRDATDFRQHLLEIAEAARMLSRSQASTKVLCAGERGTRPAVTPHATLRLPPASQTRWRGIPVCPDCDHEHTGMDNCGFYFGEGKFCRCESKVPA